MIDFHLKFTQCHGCNGYDRFDMMKFLPTGECFCTSDCEKQWSLDRRKSHGKKRLNTLGGKEKTRKEEKYANKQTKKQPDTGSRPYG